MNKKDLLENIRDYSPKEIADAIRNGVVSFYELRSGTHGQFTPMLQRQVKQKLESGDEPEAEAQTTPEEPQIDESIFTASAPTPPKSEPRLDSEPFNPAESASGPMSEPFKPATPPAPGPTSMRRPKRDPEPLSSSPVPPRATEWPSSGMPTGGDTRTTQSTAAPTYTPSFHQVEEIQRQPVQAPSFQQVQEIQQPSASTPTFNDNTAPDTATGTPKCLMKFSWGGFCFGWLWGVCNGVYWSLIALLFNILSPVFQNNSADPFLENGVPTILWIASLTVNIILGIKGNRMAWNAKKYSSAEAFDAAQNTWKKAAFIVLGIALGIIGLTIFILATL